MNELLNKISSLSLARIAIFGLLLTAGYYFSLYDSGEVLAQEIQNVRSQVEVENTKKLETEKTLRKEEQMRADVAILVKTYEEVKSKIPIEFEPSELRAIVQQISNASSLKITKLRNVDGHVAATRGPGQSNLVEELAVEYSFQGNYSQILDFMTMLSQVEKIVRVMDMRISVQDGSSGPSRYLNFDATLIGYKQAQHSDASKSTESRQ